MCALFDSTVARPRMLAETTWAEFTAQEGHQRQPSIVWDAAFDGPIPVILARFIVDEISSNECQSLLREASIDGREQRDASRRHLSSSIDTSLSEAAASACRELHLWHRSWGQARSMTKVYDFGNNYGWHALPADDHVWESEAFCRDWMAIGSAGCRAEGTSLFIDSGPLEA